MSRILISGYHGFGNYGDEAILLAIKRNLSQSIPNLQLTVLSPKPDLTAKQYDVKAINRYHVFKIIKEINKIDILISGGGSLLQDVTSTRSLLYYLTMISIAKFFRKKVMLYANGIGPIQKKVNRWLVKKVADKIDVITVRDEDSYKELIKMNIKNKKIHITADPVFTFYKENKNDMEKVHRIFKEENIPTNMPIVGISVRKWSNDEDFIFQMAKIADYIIEKYHMNVLFIPMQMSLDYEISKRIQENMKHNSYIINKEYPIEILMELIKTLHLMISMRLHTLIFSGVNEIPMIGIVYDPKVETFLKMVHQPIGANILNVDFKYFVGQIDYVMGNYLSLKEKLKEKIQLLYKEARKNDEILFELLELKDGKNEKSN